MKKNKKVNPELATAVANMMKNGELKTLADLNDLVKQLSSSFIESALQGELDDHLGYERSSQEKKETTDRRNGTYTKVLKTSVGPITVDIPRDRDGSYEPMLVPKGCSSINGLEEKIIALYADGMSQTDISAAIKDMYDVDMAQSTISAITDKVIPVMEEWRNRALEEYYPFLYVDCIYVNMKHSSENQIRKHAVYVILGINQDGHKDVLGLWMDPSESKSTWLNILESLKSRGVKDVGFIMMDGVSGLEEGVKIIFPEAIVQRCIVHLMRNSIKFIPTKCYKAFCNSIKAVYQANDEVTARNKFAEFKELWGDKYPGAVRVWENHFETTILQMLKFLSWIRHYISTTNAIESVNSSLRKMTKKGFFENQNAVFKALYLRVCKLKEKWDKTPVRNWSIVRNQMIMHPLTKEVATKYFK